MTAGKHRARKPVPESLPDLPKAELEVLACLWQKSRATAAEIREAMWHFRPMTHGAVATLLKRLEGKRLLSKEKGPAGKAFVYTPAIAPAPAYRRIMEDLRRRVFGGSGIAMVASLFETRPPGPDELKALEDIVSRLRKKHL